MDAQVWETLRLSLGAFLTSSGAGGVAAVVAAYWAYRGVQSRLAGDRQIAAEAALSEAAASRVADARQRWWEMALWIWNARQYLDPVETVVAVEALKRLVQTQEQSAMLEVLSRAIEPDQPKVEG